MADKLKVFLCHASENKPIVQQLHDDLKAAGYEPWLDKEILLYGQDWEREIKLALKQTDAVIVCFSAKLVNKEGYIQKEIKIALDVADEKPDEVIFIIPAKLEECEVPDRLNRWQWVNLFRENGYNKLRNALKLREKDLQEKT